MTQNVNPERERTEPLRPETPSEQVEASRESVSEIAEREYRQMLAEVEEAERHSSTLMTSATEGLEEIPFELNQLRRDCDDFLAENSRVMRSIADEARREAEALLDDEPVNERARDYVAHLDNHLFAKAEAQFSALPEALKNDPDAVLPLLHDLQERAEKQGGDAWEDLQQSLSIDDLNAAAAPLGERYARLFEKTGEAPRMRFMEQMLGKRLTALERSKLPPDERRSSEGGAPYDVRMALETVRRLPLSDDRREQVVLRAIAKNGASVPREFPDLCEGIAQNRIEDALAEAAPLEAARTLPEKTVARQVEVLNLLGEMFPSAAVEGLKRLPDMHHDVQMRVLLKACAAKPDIGGRLDELGLSSSEKLALGLRLARKQPDAFPEFMRATAPKLTRDEKTSLALDLIDTDVNLLRAAADGFGLSHAETVSILRSYPEARRGDLLDALRVPGSDSEVLLDEARSHAVPERFETAEDRETAKLVEKVDRASIDMMLAIERTFVGAADKERERVGEEQRLLGRIERIGVISGNSANSPRYVMIEGRVMPAVYKSRLRERKIRDGIPEGSMVNREVLASFIDRALRFDLVPATVLRSGPEGLAAVQDWKVGDIAATTGWRSEEHREELKKLGLFDWLTQNSDRHVGNWLIGQDGQHYAIDNGSIFGEKVNQYDELRSFPLTEVVGEPVPDDIRKKVEELVENVEVMNMLKEMFVTLLGNKDGKRAWKEFEGRLHRAADPDFRLPNTEWTVAHAGFKQK